MPTPTANLTGNIDAAVGEVLGIQATVRYSDAVWADQTNNTVIVGGGVIPIGADGAVDVDLPQTTDAIRVGIELSYVDNATRQRTKLWSGWRELTADTTFAEFWAFTPESPPLTDGERIAADLTDLDTRVGVLEDTAGEPTPAGGGSLIVTAGGTIDLDDTQTDGYLIGYKVTATTTIEGVSFPPGSYVFERDTGVYGGWTYRTLDTGAQVVPSPDSTAPTAGTLAASAITETGFTLAVTGATDETALHGSPYSFSPDNGSTWTAYQTSATYNVTGRTASTAHQCRHRVRDAAGNVATGTAITVTTASSFDIYDDFNRFPGSGWELVGTTASDGETVWVASPGIMNNSNPAATSLSSADDGIDLSSGRAAMVPVTQNNLTVGCTFRNLADAGFFRIGFGTSAASRLLAQHYYNGTTHGWSIVYNGSDSTVYVDPDNNTTGTVSLTYDGATATLKLNGVTVVTHAISGITSTHAGILSESPAGTLDDFSVEYL